MFATPTGMGGRRSRLRFIGLVTVVLALITAFVGARVTTPKAYAAAAASTFKGVNWADTRDNFVDGPVIPSGLSTDDSYATTYAKSAAVLNGFQATLGPRVNTVRFGMNPKTTSSTWWNSYIGAFDATLDKGWNVMLAPWAYPQSPGKIQSDTDTFAMWDKVIARYASNPHFYFEIFNEPGNVSATDWINFAARWVAHYPSIPRGQIVVAGTGYDGNIPPVGQDSRLSGTLLSLHIYSVFGTVHTTEAQWITQLNSQVGAYASRTIITEFGLPMTTGVNYNGAKDGDNNRSYYWALTDSIRSQGLGSVYWPGLRNNDTFALTTLHGTGTNLTLTVNNASGVERLQNAWGGAGGTPPTTPVTTRPPATTTPPPSTTRPPVTTTPPPSTTRPPVTTTPPPSSTSLPASTPPQTTGAPTGGLTCTASNSAWNGGFVTTVTISNRGASAVSGWTVNLTYDRAVSVSSSWGATTSISGTRVTAQPVSWSSAVSAGGTQSFGLQGAASGNAPAPGCTVA